MKNKSILIILDGLDFDYIQKNINDLHFFKELNENGRFFPLESVVPADSIPSWTTIYTGKNPAEHGILESIDYLNFKKKKKGDYSIIQGNAIWDVLSRQGKRVFVFNPFIAYPAWDVNGLMISGPVFQGGEVSTNHSELVDTTALPDIGGMVEQPSNKEMLDFYKNTMDLTQRQFDAFHDFFLRDCYDFALLGITTPDRMQHFLWRYNDSGDRTHPKRNNRLRGSILAMYQLMDINIRRIFDEYGEEYNIIVISDHGHGRRCEKTFYINQWLIDQGIIRNRSRKKRMIEYAKNTIFKLMAQLHCVHSGTKFFKYFGFAHKVKNADYLFSANYKEAVFVPKFDGTNPYGGIVVDRDKFNSREDYENMRQRIIDGLYQVKDHGAPVMIWVKRREEIYDGEKISNYPDIVYRMQPCYGVDRGLYGKRWFGINAMHEIISGGHTPVGVIMGNRDDVSEVESVLNIHKYVVKMCNE